ncbi:hypothetical protein FRC11_002134, partial [Ceratobasidium sp. 423]
MGLLSILIPGALFDRRTKPPAIKFWDEDRIISEALGWLIENCETPSSVEIALQAIAGASPRIPRKPLEDCQASMKILQHLVSSTSHSGTTPEHLSLYARAYEFLGTTAQRDTNALGAEVKGEFEVMIWELQSKNE